jgi:hypothetical protein
MPIYMIERHLAEEYREDLEAASELNVINDDEDIRWLYSFLSEDLRKTYCLYEAPNAEAIRAAAERAGIPADLIIELAGRIENTGAIVPIPR